MHWWLEAGVFGSGCDLTAAARRAGHDVTAWRDEWWAARGWPSAPETEVVVFHGSLANAARVREERLAQPGSYCDVAALRWTAWCERARPWLLNAAAVMGPAADVVASPPAWDPIFVRPDSPLKPFSGRVVARDALTLAALDIGFYYDDPTVLVVAAPARPIRREWRYVVCAGEVVAGSAYAADGRRALADDPTGSAWRFAQTIAREIGAPEPVYVMDLCESEGALWLLELNPFSGADLYACDADAVVRGVATAAAGGA